MRFLKSLNLTEKKIVLCSFLIGNQLVVYSFNKNYSANASNCNCD